jgi:hypothetical protein
MEPIMAAPDNLKSISWNFGLLQAWFRLDMLRNHVLGAERLTILLERMLLVGLDIQRQMTFRTIENT